MSVPGYCKILRVGSRGIERTFVGDVVIQEKVDGSFFGFGCDEEGQYCCRSHHKQLDMEDPNKMFAEAVVHVMEGLVDTSEIEPGCFFYAEWLQKPKHNTLAYDHRPTNGLVLFDAVIDGRLVTDRDELCHWAEFFNIDVIPELWRGPATLESCEQLLHTKSYLGGTEVEGVVIKNFGENVAFGGISFPLFAKLVQSTFTERNSSNWKKDTSKGRLQKWLDSFCTEARWEKAVQSARDEERLEGTPRDIGMLVKAVQADLREEEAETIKEELYNIYVKDVCKAAIRGLPQWYKDRLTDTMRGSE